MDREAETELIRRVYAKQVMAAAFAKGGAERMTRLYRHLDLPEEECWVRGDGRCLVYR